MATPQLLTSEEVCRRLMISKDTLKHWVMKNEIPHTHIGRSVRFLEDDINEIIYQKYTGRKLK